MCTSLTLPIADLASAEKRLFGRTLDLDTHFGERVTLTRRGTPLLFGNLPAMESHHALLGTAAVEAGYPLYAEAMNDCGLCMAGLRFSGYAAYAERPMAGLLNLAPWELIPYLLGKYATVEEVRNALTEICVVGRPFSEKLPAAPLHWHVADADPAHGELVVECTAEGVRVFENPVGVLTNPPPFDEQLDRLATFASLSSACDRTLGGGGVGLPGDYTSASRFVRAATLRRWSVERMRERQTAWGAKTDGGGAPLGEDASVARFFGILAAVAPPDGAVLTEEGQAHRTLYACCMDGAAGAYHRITEGSTAVRTVLFSEGEADTVL